MGAKGWGTRHLFQPPPSRSHGAGRSHLAFPALPSTLLPTSTPSQVGGVAGITERQGPKRGLEAAGVCRRRRDPQGKQLLSLHLEIN